MYYQAIAQLAHSLTAAEVWLDKAQQHAAAQQLDIEVLMGGRLAPDMKPFIYQIQSACDYVKAGAAWLTGQPPPKHEDDERTIEEVRARIDKTVTFVRSVPESEYAAAHDRRVGMSWGPPGTVLGGRDYLLQMTIPNVYFHLSMAYAILRHQGVDLGKLDFLGHVNWVPGERS